MYITVYKTVIHLQILSQEKVIHGFSNYLLVILFCSILCNIVKKFAPILPLCSIGRKKATFRKNIFCFLSMTRWFLINFSRFLLQNTLFLSILFELTGQNRKIWSYFDTLDISTKIKKYNLFSYKIFFPFFGKLF
jgi:hypothetical protein